VANPTTEVNAYLLRVPAGGRPFRVIEVNVYLLRVPGNVTGITNNVDTTRSQSFTYDHLNRILTAETTSTYATSPTHCWGESYTYDQWGNLTAIGVASTSYNSCTQESLSVTALSNNQLSETGYSYDASGNMLTDGRNTYTWNAESQLKTGAGVMYTYDGDGHRVEKSNGTLYWYGVGSDSLMETDLSGNLTDEYIFFGGKRIARRDSSNNVVYYAADHLGTSRVVTSSAGAILDQSDFYPFGGERVLSASSGNTYKFTSKERDSESNLDNFGARYDSSILGRFMSPDEAFADQHPANPQSWNLYTYTGNNPLRNIDPNGRGIIDLQALAAKVSSWFTGGVKRDGGAGNFAKNNAIGAAKGTGSFLANTVKTASAAGQLVSGNPVGAMQTMMTSNPQALQPSNQTQAQASTATQVTLTVATAVIGGEASAGEATTTAIHFTDDAGMAAISSSGFLNADTFVTLPSEIPSGASSSAVEDLLGIDPGKGANSIIFDTSTDNLRIPFNGPTTDGGALQFQLNNPVPIDPANFKPLK